jgi:hypothetical protein
MNTYPPGINFPSADKVIYSSYAVPSKYRATDFALRKTCTGRVGVFFSRNFLLQIPLFRNKILQTFTWDTGSKASTIKPFFYKIEKWSQVGLQPVYSVTVPQQKRIGEQVF